MSPARTASTAGPTACARSRSAALPPAPASTAFTAHAAGAATAPAGATAAAHPPAARGHQQHDPGSEAGHEKLWHAANFYQSDGRRKRLDAHPLVDETVGTAVFVDRFRGLSDRPRTSASIKFPAFHVDTDGATEVA